MFEQDLDPVRIAPYLSVSAAPLTPRPGQRSP